jgi:hypothetical protein
MPDNDAGRAVTLFHEGPVYLGRFKMLRVEGCAPGSRWKVTLLSSSQRVERYPGRGLVELYRANLFDVTYDGLYYLPGVPGMEYDKYKAKTVFDVSRFRGLYVVLSASGVANYPDRHLALRVTSCSIPEAPEGGIVGVFANDFEVDAVETNSVSEAMANEGRANLSVLIMPGVTDRSRPGRVVLNDFWPYVAVAVVSHGPGEVLIGSEPSHVTLFGVV